MKALLPLFLLLSLISCHQAEEKTSVQNPLPPAEEVSQERSTATQLNENVDLGIPTSQESLSEIIVSRKQYVLSWNHLTRNLNWAAWKLEPKFLGNAKRSKFAIDSELDQYLKEKSLGKGVVTTDYTNSCFNRGHTVPSADRNATPEDNKATFFMSNITPQTSFLNQIAWGHLEYFERAEAQAGKTLYIYAGPIYEKDMGGIGANADIKIPTHFFKIIVSFDSTQTTHTVTKETPMIIVIMPNVTSAGTWPDEDHETLCNDSKKLPTTKADFNDWKKYQTTLEEVENKTGLKFFEQNVDQILSPVIIAA